MSPILTHLRGNESHIQEIEHIFSSFKENKKADYIFASDVAACPYEEHYESLVQTMQQLSDEHTVIFLTYQVFLLP